MWNVAVDARYRRHILQLCFAGSSFDFGRTVNDLWQTHRGGSVAWSMGRLPRHHSAPVTSPCPGYPKAWLPEVNASDHFTTLHPGLPKGGTGCFKGDVQFPPWDPATPESGYAALRAAWAAPGGGVTPENHWTAEWAATPRFKECYASFSPRFEAEIARGVPPAPLLANEAATNFTSAMR